MSPLPWFFKRTGRVGSQTGLTWMTFIALDPPPPDKTSKLESAKKHEKSHAPTAITCPASDEVDMVSDNGKKIGDRTC